MFLCFPCIHQYIINFWILQFFCISFNFWFLFLRFCIWKNESIKYGSYNFFGRGRIDISYSAADSKSDGIVLIMFMFCAGLSKIGKRNHLMIHMLHTSIFQVLSQAVLMLDSGRFNLHSRQIQTRFNIC